MKKYYILFVICSLFFLTGCSLSSDGSFVRAVEETEASPYVMGNIVYKTSDGDIYVAVQPYPDIDEYVVYRDNIYTVPVYYIQDNIMYAINQDLDGPDIPVYIIDDDEYMTYYVLYPTIPGTYAKDDSRKKIYVDKV